VRREARSRSEKRIEEIFKRFEGYIALEEERSLKSRQSPGIFREIISSSFKLERYVERRRDSERYGLGSINAADGPTDIPRSWRIPSEAIVYQSSDRGSE